MENQNDPINRLAGALSELIKFVPTTKEELTLWYDAAQAIMNDREMMVNAPHFLYHYFHDADIRMKDSKYAEMQNARVNDLLDYLRRGVMPADDEV
jgi:hypothetical protein